MTGALIALIPGGHVVVAVEKQVVGQSDAVDERGGVERAVPKMHDEFTRQRVVHDVVGQTIEMLRVVPIRGTHMLPHVRVGEDREVHRRLGRRHRIEIPSESRGWPRRGLALRRRQRLVPRRAAARKWILNATASADLPR